MEWIVALTFQGHSAPQYLHGSRRVVEAETRAQAIDIVEKSMIASRGVGLGALTMVYCEPNSPAGGTDEDLDYAGEAAGSLPFPDDDEQPLGLDSSRIWRDYVNMRAKQEWARAVRDPHVAAPAATFPKPEPIRVDEDGNVCGPDHPARVTNASQRAAIRRALAQLRSALSSTRPEASPEALLIRGAIDDLSVLLAGPGA